MRIFGQFYPPFVQSLSFFSESQRRRNRRRSEQHVPRVKAAERVKSEACFGNKVCRCHSESRKKTIIIRCWRTWPAAVFDPAPLPYPLSLLSPAPASSGGSSSPCLTTCSLQSSAPWSDSRHKANWFITVCPPAGSFVSMTTAMPWHPVSTVILPHRSKLMNGECSSVARRGACMCDCFECRIMFSSSSPAGTFKATASRGGWEIFLIVASSVFHFSQRIKLFLGCRKSQKIHFKTCFHFFPLCCFLNMYLCEATMKKGSG